MARMIPAIDPTSIENRGEQAFYVAIRDHTPRSWTCRYNWHYSVHSGRRVTTGEIDFVLAVPNHGVMVFETKGFYGYECHHGVWYNLDQFGGKVSERTENPFEQADKNKHNLAKFLCDGVLKIDKQRFPGIYGHAVVYPRAIRKSALPASQSPLVLLAAADVRPENLERSILEAFRSWGDVGTQGAQFVSTWMQKVVAAFEDNVKARPAVSGDVDDETDLIDIMTERQYEVFEAAKSNRRLLVSGEAGSGKTVIGCRIAEELARDGKKVLFLCFNRMLAEWLRLTAGFPNGVQAQSFHVLCRNMVIEAANENRRRLGDAQGLEWNPGVDSDGHQQWFKQVAPNLLCDAIDVLGEKGKFDAIIVDEAHDFASEWWLPVEMLLHDAKESQWYVFHDPEQARVYGQGVTLPDIAVNIELKANCRNTRRIAGYCGKVIDRVSKTRDGAPDGELPVLGAASNQVDLRRQHAAKVVSQWLASGISPDRIAILSPWNEENPKSVLNGLKDVGTISVQMGERFIQAWIDGKAVFGCTIKAFKGLEADCIVICDVPECGTPGFSAADMYVAASRAKARLHFIPETPTATNQIQEWINSLELSVSR